MRFQILSLSGGGYLGLYTASLLAALEWETGAPLARRFGLLAGTSAGGIIALALAAEIPATHMCDMFVESGSRIFSTRPPRTGLLPVLGRALGSLLRAEYDGRSLRAALEAAFGRERRLGDLAHRLLVPTVKLSNSQPYIFKGGDLPGAAVDASVRVVDVAMATAAAPTFFPAVEIGDGLFIDGGLYAAMPDLLALEAAEHDLGIAREDVRLLSVGTTSIEFSFARRSRLRLGTLDWTRDERFIRTLLAAQQGWVNRMMTDILGPHFLRLDRAQTKQQQALLRLHIAPPRAAGMLRDMAEETVRDALADERLRAMLTHDTGAGRQGRR